MAYIGRNLEQFSNVEKLDNITFTNSAGPYNLLKGAVAFVPANAQSLLIEVDGIIQASDSYTVSGSTITFGVSMASTSTMNSIVQLGVGLISTPADGTVSTAKLEDGAVTGAKVNSTFDVSAKTVTLPASVSGLGTGITNAQLAGSIDVTSKITGVVPTANLGSGSASASTYLAGDQSYKTITEFNDNKIVNDISTLALHQATNNNSAKYNLTNSNVDVYQDSSAIANLTDVARDTTGEYISSVSTVESAFSDDANTDMLLHMDDTGLTDSAGNISAPTLNNGAARSSTQSKFGGYSVSLNGSTQSVHYPDNAKFNYGTNDFTFEFWIRLNAVNTDYTVLSGREDDTNRYHVYINGTSTQVQLISFQSSSTVVNCIAPYTFVADTWTHVACVRASGVVKIFVNGTSITLTTDTPAGIMNNHSGNMSVGNRQDGTGYVNGYIDEVRFSDNARYSTNFTPNSTTTSSATGSYESTAQTANASVTTMSGVVTYTNNVGTATLNTDIILQVSADNGSTWQNAALTAAGTFSTGVLQAVTNDITVATGTQIKYKMSFANQASASKVTRINGVSLSY